jgi:integration host factor subunit beta
MNGSPAIRSKSSPDPSLESLLKQENQVVTKKDIVRTISDEIGMTQLQTKDIVQKTFSAIINALVEGGAPTETERGGRIELRNFGVFEVKRRAPRKARNPRTGAKVFVPEKFVVTFKPGKEMEERVHELERQAAAKAKLSADGQAFAMEKAHAAAMLDGSSNDS